MNDNMNANIDITGVRLESPRLILREWNLSDVDDLFEYASVPGVGEMAGWPHHKDKEESLFRVNRFIETKRTFALVYKENNKVIGSLGIELYAAEESFPELMDYQGRSIGYVLSKDYWGKGLMPEAVKLVIDYCFNVLKLDFLFCDRYDFNNQSRRVQEKCGFKQYRRDISSTNYGTRETGVMNILVNPNNKDIKLDFSKSEEILDR